MEPAADEVTVLTELPTYLVCHVCSGALREPRVLHCLHSFCAACLSSSGGGSCGDVDAGSSGEANDRPLYLPFKPPQLVCPLCNFVTSTVAVDKLPQNYAALELLRKRRGLASCFNCGTREADVYCLACLSPLCSECNDRIHVHRILRGHRSIPLRVAEDAPRGLTTTSAGASPSKGKTHSTTGATGGGTASVAAPPSPSAAAADLVYQWVQRERRVPTPCPRHHLEILVTFCRQCLQSVCPRCVEEDHSNHPTAAFASVTLPRLQEDLPEYYEALNNAAEQCRTAVSAVSEAAVNLKAYHDGCMEKINARFASLQDLLDRRRRELQSEVSTEYHRKAGLLKQQLETLHSRSEAAQRAMWMSTTLIDPDAGSAIEPHVSPGADAALSAGGDKPSTLADVAPTRIRTLPLPSNTSPSFVADVTAVLDQVVAYAQSQRIDLTANVETQLRISFSGQEEPLERLLQSFGSFHSKKSRERHFPQPALLLAEGTTAPVGLVHTPHGSKSTTPRTGSAPVTAAPYFGPLDGGAVTDTSGLLYFFGCAGGIMPYQNPFLRGVVEVRASSIGYGKLENVVQFFATSQQRKQGARGGQGSEKLSPLRGGGSRPGSPDPRGTLPAVGKDFCTQNVPFSWVTVKIPAPVELEAYTLYHDAYDPTSHFLRSWEVRGLVHARIASEAQLRQTYHYQGVLYVEVSEGKWVRSTDPDASKHIAELQRMPPSEIGVEHSPRWWVVLDVRKNCDALRPGCTSACLTTSLSVTTAENAANADLPPGAGRIPCKQFALVQTHVNSSGDHHLMVSCVELYGTLLGD